MSIVIEELGQTLIALIYSAYMIGVFIEMLELVTAF